jgi:hypothetical protein
MAEFIVITKIPDPANPEEEEARGNLALAFPLYIEQDDTVAPVPVMQAMALRAPVFQLGEIIVCEHGREIGGDGRKPSKWYISYETFTNAEDAIKRSREVTA